MTCMSRPSKGGDARQEVLHLYQRRLGIGYNRAASLVEADGKDGLVGPANHVGKREILTGSRD